MKMQQQASRPIKVEFQGRIRRFRVGDDDLVIASLAQVLGVDPERLFVHDGERIMSLESVVGEQSSVSWSRSNGRIPRFYAEVKPGIRSPDDAKLGALVLSLQRIYRAVDSILVEVHDIKRAISDKHAERAPTEAVAVCQAPAVECSSADKRDAPVAAADDDSTNEYEMDGASEVSEADDEEYDEREQDAACVVLDDTSSAESVADVKAVSDHESVKGDQPSSYLPDEREDIDADSLSSEEDIDALDDELIDRMADVICESSLSEDLDASRDERPSDLADSFVVVRRQSIQQSQLERIQSLSASIKKVEADHTDVLQRLAAMGFSNSKLNASVLLTHNYDFQATVEALDRFRSMSMGM